MTLKLLEKLSAGRLLKAVFYAAGELIFAVYLAFFLSYITPVFDAVPSFITGYLRMAALFVGITGRLLLRSDRGASAKDVFLAALGGIGIFVFLMFDVGAVLDIFVVIVLLTILDIDSSLRTAFVFFCGAACATLICACKGYVRSYSLYGINLWGIRSIPGAVLSALALIGLSAFLIIRFVRSEEKKKYIAAFIPAILISLVTVLVFMKALNLSSAVDAGSYEIYAADTAMGLEADMKGFDDYVIDFKGAAPTSFDIIPEGDFYIITMDSYGVTKTLYVCDDKLAAGNYEQSASSYLWDIRAIPGTAFFSIKNAACGLFLTFTEEGDVKLLKDPVDERSYKFRIGSENLAYYSKLGGEILPSYDLANADIDLPDAVVYTGSPAEPEITVNINGAVLIEGTDYLVSYKNNILPGVSYALIRGTGDYSGSASSTFCIIYGDDMCDDPDYEAVASYVVTVYRLGYRRFPANEEVIFYFRQLMGDNRTPDSVIWEIINNGGLRVDDAQFIEALYRLMLLRNGSRAELSNWIGELERVNDRGIIIKEITDSPDYQNIWHGFGAGFR